MSKRDRRVPLMRYLTRKLGVRRGYMCMAFIVAWGTAQEMFEHDHPGEEFGITRYAEWWKVSEATAYREQVLFREAFPNLSTPSDLIEEIRRQGVGSVQQLRFTP